MMRMTRAAKAILVLVLLMLGPAAAFGGTGGRKSVTFGFTTPRNTEPKEVEVTFRDKDAMPTRPSVKATIPPGTSAGRKAELIKKALEAAGHTVEINRGKASITIKHLNRHEHVKFHPGGTKEKADRAIVKESLTALITFGGTFPNAADDGGPAAFVAGVITDLGRVEVEFRATEFAAGEEVAGSYIAERLYSALVDDAAQIGAYLELEDDTILVSYDPAYNSEAGVVFGTSSPGEGLTAAAGVTTEDPPVADPI